MSKISTKASDRCHYVCCLTLQVRVRLSYILFEDGGQTVVYCPALDVYGYGADEREAKESFKVCMSEYLEASLKELRDKKEQLKLEEYETTRQ